MERANDLHAQTQALMAELEEIKPTLGMVPQYHAELLLRNARLFGAGYSQRAFMRRLIQEARAA